MKKTLKTTLLLLITLVVYISLTLVATFIFVENGGYIGVPYQNNSTPWKTDNFDPSYNTGKRIPEVLRYTYTPDVLGSKVHEFSTIEKIKEEMKEMDGSNACQQSMVIASKVSSTSYYWEKADVGYTDTVMRIEEVIGSYDGSTIQAGDTFRILELYTVRPSGSIDVMEACYYLTEHSTQAGVRQFGHFPYPNPLIKNNTSYLMVINEPTDLIKSNVGVSLDNAVFKPEKFENMYFNYYAVELGDDALNTAHNASIAQNDTYRDAYLAMISIVNSCNIEYSDYKK